jgi:RNA polymerase sigma-70 factor (ECF subfamily)
VSEPNDLPADESSFRTRPSFIRRVGHHDAESWAEFVTLYEPILRAYVGDCARRVGVALSAEEREDVQQDLWIKLHHAVPKFDFQARFRTWLWRVTRNLVIDWLRREYGRHNRPKQTPLTPAVLERLSSDDEPPGKDLDREHDERVLRHILRKVKVEMHSAHKWDCFEMHYLLGESSAVVAEKLALSVSAVNTYTSRVLARIRELGQEYDVEPQ